MYRGLRNVSLVKDKLPGSPQCQAGHHRLLLCLGHCPQCTTSPHKSKQGWLCVCDPVLGRDHITTTRTPECLMQSLVVASFLTGLEHESSAKPGWETNPRVSVMPSRAESSLHFIPFSFSLLCWPPPHGLKSLGQSPS